MTATLLYRIAAVLFVLFALGHTVGFLRFKAPSAEGRAVFESMDRVVLAVGGSRFTYGGFYRGFGLIITAYLLFSAFLAWFLGDLAVRHPQSIGPLAWSFFLLQVVSLVLSWIYFSAGPAILSALVTVALGGAAWLTQRAAP
jgi:hypothetical protein